MKPTSRHPSAVSRQPSSVERRRSIRAAIKAGLTVFSFAAVTALAAFPATGFAQAARVGAAETTHAPNRGSAGTNLVPGPGEPGGGGGVPTGPGGSSGSGSGPVLTYYDRNTTAHTARVHLSNGAEVAVDSDANRVTVTYAGQTKSFTLHEVLLKAANGNAALAAAREASLRTELSNPIGNARLQRLSGATPESYFRARGRATMPPNSAFMPRGSAVSPHLINGPGGWYTPFGCSAYYACRYQVVDYDFWGPMGYGFWFWETDDSYPTQHTDDWYYWNRWREDHCAAAKSNAETALVFTAGLATSIFLGPAGFITAAVSGLGIIISMNHQASNERICLSAYPGPRQWN